MFPTATDSSYLETFERVICQRSLRQSLMDYFQIMCWVIERRGRPERRRAKCAIERQVRLLGKHADLLPPGDEHHRRLLQAAKNVPYRKLRVLERTLWRAGVSVWAGTAYHAKSLERNRSWRLAQRVRELVLKLAPRSARTERRLQALFHLVLGFFGTGKVDARNNP